MVIPEIWKDILRQSPQAVIAGGAVRDLWLEGPVKDIDVFIWNANWARPMFVPEGGIHIDTPNRNEEYEGTQILAIENFLVTDQDVQIIYIDRPFSEYIETFDLSTSYAWYNGGLHFEPEFMRTMDTGVISIVNAQGSPNKINRRAQRVVEKYPNLTYTPLTHVPEEIPF